MKYNRSLSVSYALVAVICLTGFKQHSAKTHSITKHQAVEEETKQQKKLDLSIPKREISFQEPPELLANAQTVLPSVDINNKNDNREVELKGKVIMSQELEAGKTKSADGAGIVINFHH